MIDCMLAGNDRSYVNFGGMAFGKHGLITQFHTAACSQHRIGDNQRFVVNAGRSDIFYMYIKFQGIFIFSIGGHKCIFCSVEIA